MTAPPLSSPGAPIRGTVDAENPWPGLLSFREVDEPFFRGRTFESEALVRLVDRQRLSVLFGLSGLGKSSLLRAGVFPRVRQQNILPVYIRFDFSAEAPGIAAQTKATIAREAMASGVEAPPARNGETLWEYFHRQDADFWDRRNRPVLPLLVLDQFEEFFTLGRRDSAAAAASDTFLAELGDLVEGRCPAALKARLDADPAQAREFSFGKHRYKVLLGLREDFLPELEGLRERVGLFTLNRMRLRRMNGEAALQVVSQARDLVAPDVAERIIRFVAVSEKGEIPLSELLVEPALLSVVCRELNNKRRERGEPKITAGLLEGSQKMILSDFYERSVADLGPGVRAFMEERLLTVSGFRNSEALENALGWPGVSREAIERLVERRLVRIEDRAGVPRLELTHDLLTGVIGTSRDRRRAREAQERERRALAQLRRSQRVAAGFLFLSLLAGGAALWAALAQRRAHKDESRAQQDEVNLRKSLDAYNELQRKQENAEKQHQDVEQALREVTKQQGALIASLQEAVSQVRRDANARTRQALSQADTQQKQAQAAVKQLQEAEQAKKQAEEIAAQARREAAQSIEAYSQLKWIPSSGSGPPKGAYQGGQDQGRAVYVCRGRYQGSLHPGGTVGGNCSIGWDGREVLLSTYEALLSAGPLKWVPGGAIPWNAVAGGEEKGLPLYVCRGSYQGGLYPGKVVRGNINGEVLVCNIAAGGKEIVFCPTCSDRQLKGLDSTLRERIVLDPYQVLTWQ
jgi:hypothetical protein